MVITIPLANLLMIIGASLSNPNSSWKNGTYVHRIYKKFIHRAWHHAHAIAILSGFVKMSGQEVLSNYYYSELNDEAK